MNQFLVDQAVDRRWEPARSDSENIVRVRNDLASFLRPPVDPYTALPDDQILDSARRLEDRRRLTRVPDASDDPTAPDTPTRPPAAGPRRKSGMIQRVKDGMDTYYNRRVR